MAKGFGKGFVTGVAWYSCCCRRCSLHIQGKSNRTRRRTKAAFIEENRKKQHVAVSHTNHSKAPGKPELFCIC